MTRPHPNPPTPGRHVHYVARGSADEEFPPVCRAAIVTSVGGWRGLSVTHRPPDDIDGEHHRTLHQVWDPHIITATVLNPGGVFSDLIQADHGTRDHTHPGAVTCANHRDPTYPPGLPGVPPRDSDPGGFLLHAPGTWHYPAGTHESAEPRGDR